MNCSYYRPLAFRCGSLSLSSYISAPRNLGLKKPNVLSLRSNIISVLQRLRVAIVALEFNICAWGSVQTLGQCPRALLAILFFKFPQVSNVTKQLLLSCPPLITLIGRWGTTSDSVIQLSNTKYTQSPWPSSSNLYDISQNDLLCACFACNPRLQLFGFAAWVSEITLLFSQVLEDVAGRPLCIHINLLWARYCTPIFNWDTPR